MDHQLDRDADHGAGENVVHELGWAVGRLQQLRGEYASGASQLAEIDRHHARVREQLLRIEGAIRVLEEQLAAAPEFVAATAPSA